MTNLDPRREGRPRFHSLTCDPDCIPPCHCQCDCHPDNADKEDDG